MQWVPFPVYPAEQKQVGRESVELLRQLKQDRDKQSLTTHPGGKHRTNLAHSRDHNDHSRHIPGIHLQLQTLQSCWPGPGVQPSPSTVHLHHTQELLQGTGGIAGALLKTGVWIMDGEGSTRESFQPCFLPWQGQKALVNGW